MTEEEWDLQVDVMQLLVLQGAIKAIKYYKERTKCSLKEALQFVSDLEPSFRKMPSNTKCRYCGKYLRTDLAKQCFECGRDWH